MSEEPSTGHDSPSAVKGFRLDFAGLPIPLKRTGGAIDRIFAIPLEAVGDWVEKKFKGNVDEHVQHVQKSRAKRNKRTQLDEASLSVGKAAALREWAARAGEIDDEDKVLSAAWRAALDRILDDSGEEEELLRILTALRKETLRKFFIGFRTKAALFSIATVTGKESEHIKQLEGAELIRPMLPARLGLIVGAVFGFYFWALGQYFFSDRLGGLEPYIVMFAFLFAGAFYLIGQIYVPTRQGSDLLKRYFIYADSRASPEK